jgi:hypothetical protein
MFILLKQWYTYTMNRKALFAVVVLALTIPGPVKAQNAVQEADIIQGELSFILSNSVVQSGYLDVSSGAKTVSGSYNNIVSWDTVPALAGTEAFGVIRMDYNNYRYVTGSLMLRSRARIKCLAFYSYCLRNNEITRPKGHVISARVLTAPADPVSAPLVMDDSGIRSGTGQFTFRAPARDVKAVCDFRKFSGSGAVRQGVGAVTGP